ncbi:MAG: hypothetical protein ACREU6_00675 [Steroidobacteraceae bacterium]
MREPECFLNLLAAAIKPYKQHVILPNSRRRLCLTTVVTDIPCK